MTYTWSKQSPEATCGTTTLLSLALVSASRISLASLRARLYNKGRYKRNTTLHTLVIKGSRCLSHCCNNIFDLPSYLGEGNYKSLSHDLHCFGSLYPVSQGCDLSVLPTTKYISSIYLSTRYMTIGGSMVPRDPLWVKSIWFITWCSFNPSIIALGAWWGFECMGIDDK